MAISVEFCSLSSSIILSTVERAVLAACSRNSSGSSFLIGRLISKLKEILRVVHWIAILFLKAISEKGVSDIARLGISSDVILKRFYKRGASFRWSFGPHSTWGSIGSTTILTTHPSLQIRRLSF